MMYLSKIKIAAIFFIIFFLLGLQVMGAPTIASSGKIKYEKILEKEFPGEAVTADPIYKILVRAIDYRRNGTKSGIVIVRKGLYILNSRGTILSAKKDLFSHDVQQIRFAKLSESGRKDNIIVAYWACNPYFFVFDRLGTLLSFINIPGSVYQNVIGFYTKDINGDGIDEIITSNLAFRTEDGGFTWKTVYDVENLYPGRRGKTTPEANEFESLYKVPVDYYEMDMRLGGDPDFGDNICARFFTNMIALDAKGKIVFKTRLPPPRSNYYWIANDFPYIAGDFSGSGKRDMIAAVADIDQSKIFMLDKNGAVKDVFPINIGSKSASAVFLRSGKILSGAFTDQILVSCERYGDKGIGVYGIAVYDKDGQELWEYITDNKVSHAFIEDLNSDGTPEIILGLGDPDKISLRNKGKILILSNKGKLIQEIVLSGELYGSRWGSYNPAMDIADINGDGVPEILAVTRLGVLYIFGQKK